jgi:hypothetical protein
MIRGFRRGIVTARRRRNAGRGRGGRIGGTVDSDLCRLHYRPAAARCAGCGRGACAACLRAGDLCAPCDERREAAAVMARERRSSRLALRRAGVAVRAERGDPVILRDGRLRLLVPLLGGAATLVAVAAACLQLERRWQVHAALGALVCALAVGLCVRLLFGGVSRVAGLVAAGLCVTAALAAAQWPGVAAAGPAAGLGVQSLSTWVLSHGAAAPALYAVAALLAYSTAAGHRAA